MTDLLKEGAALMRLVLKEESAGGVTHLSRDTERMVRQWLSDVDKPCPDCPIDHRKSGVATHLNMMAAAQGWRCPTCDALWSTARPTEGLTTCPNCDKGVKEASVE